MAATRNLAAAIGATDEVDDFTVAPIGRRIASDAHYDEEIRVADRESVTGSGGSSVCNCGGGPCSTALTA